MTTVHNPHEGVASTAAFPWVMQPSRRGTRRERSGARIRGARCTSEIIAQSSGTTWSTTRKPAPPRFCP